MEKKECSILSDQFSMSESDLLKRLDYLIECNFLFKTFENDKCFQYLQMLKNLVLLLEGSDAFDGAINGLETMDSYLN